MQINLPQRIYFARVSNDDMYRKWDVVQKYLCCILWRLAPFLFFLVYIVGNDIETIAGVSYSPAKAKNSYRLYIQESIGR